MRLNQLRSIHNWIRNSETSELLFVTALILPGYLLLYNAMITQINPQWQIPGLTFALVIYVAGITWMKSVQSSGEKDSRDLLIIKNHILDKGFRFMSFEKIQDIDNSFDEQRVRALLFTFPTEMRLARLKGNKQGIKIINVEDEAE